MQDRTASEAEGSAKELTPLREQIWRLRGRRSRSAGTSLFLLGGVLFALAFLTRYIVFEVSAILAFLVGAVLMFTSADRYVKMRIANSFGITSFKSLGELMSLESVKVFSIFEFDRVSHKPFATFEGSRLNPHVMPDEPANRHSIPFSGESLFVDMLDELRGTESTSLDDLIDSLPQVLVEGTGLAEKVIVRRESQALEIRLWGMAFRHFCREEGVRALCGRIGCPLNSSIASLLAMSSNNPIRMEGCFYSDRDRLTLLRYTILASSAENKSSVTETRAEN